MRAFFWYTRARFQLVPKRSKWLGSFLFLLMTECIDVSREKWTVRTDTSLAESLYLRIPGPRNCKLLALLLLYTDAERGVFGGRSLWMALAEEHRVTYP
ncbi:hypothetical protein DSUL_100029 [Desulfovibrionales bacterium]